MSPAPRISIVIPAYNCARYLPAAIESALGQSLAPLEVIVVDDGSTDGVADAAGRYAASVRYVYQVNAGSGPARNAGVGMAQGDWLAFLDGDDYWDADKLARQAAAVLADPALDIVFAHVQQFFSDDIDPALAERIRLPKDPMPGCCASAMLIRRAAFDRVGLFATGYQVSEFLDWYSRATAAELRETTLSDVLVYRRVHGGNNSLRWRAAIGEYARVLKAAIDRRRRASPP